MSEAKISEKTSQFRLAEWFPDLSREQLQKLEIFHNDLMLANRSASLVPQKTVGSFDTVYFADCIFGSRLIFNDCKNLQSILDLGSGVGFPSLIFAILYPQVQVVALDGDARKCAFLKEIVSKLSISNLSVVQGMSDTANVGEFDVVMVRDFNTISRTLLAAKKLVKPGGSLYHFKGDEWAMEVSEMPSQLCSLWQPSLVGEYRLVGGGVRKEYIIKTARF